MNIVETRKYYFRIFFILFIITITPACKYKDERIDIKNIPCNCPAGNCINVKGRVLGDIKPNSSVFLYNTPDINFSSVMNQIRKSPFSQKQLVDKQMEFEFGCLPMGTYTFAIPTSSYNTSVGSPLPYEYDCRNHSIKIAFQGGDYQYAVGAFYITGNRESITVINQSGLIEKRGSLYRACPK